MWIIFANGTQYESNDQPQYYHGVWVWIEGIYRNPTDSELTEHNRFIGIERLSITEIQNFLSVYQPDARLRDKPGMNVAVGKHVPPKGGPEVVHELQKLIDKINSGDIDTYAAHCKYETLHPFTDGNGRSGRAIWYWMMRSHTFSTLGFLHAWYYQSLQRVSRRGWTRNANE